MLRFKENNQSLKTKMSATVAHNKYGKNLFFSFLIFFFIIYTYMKLSQGLFVCSHGLRCVEIYLLYAVKDLLFTLDSASIFVFKISHQLLVIPHK